MPVDTETGTDTAVEPAVFRQAMARLASGVNIITVWDDQSAPHGMTATAFCSVSAEPAQVLVCVNRETRTHRLVVQAGAFGVSVLPAGAHGEHISAHCARPGGDKRLTPDWLAADAGSRTPVVDGALVHVDCEVADQFDAATHTIFVGRVRDVVVGDDGEPLVYFRGAYRQLA